MLTRTLFILISISSSVLSFQDYKPITTSYNIDNGADVGTPLFLTPLLKKGQYKAAQQLSKVNPEIGNLTSYSGFLTVNKTCNSNLFFWFFPAQKVNWTEAPLVLWLQGGPGVPSMYGLFTEVGPFSYLEGRLIKRVHSWNVENNLLFIDQPVGVGYSFTGKDQCYPQDETAVGIDLYEAVLQFHQLFPNFQQNKFFITGESYAGHFIPALGYTIYKNNPSANVKINLAVMMIGNGWFDPVTQIDYASHLYQLGLIDDSVKKVYKSYQDQFVQQVHEKNWSGAYETCNRFTGRLFEQFVGNVSVYNILKSDLDDNSDWVKFIQMPETRSALHTGKLSYFTPDNYPSLMADSVQSVKPWVEELLIVYPIIFYNGQLDIICAYPMMINYLRSLSWKGQAQYLNSSRNQWCVENELAGYYKGTHNLYDVLVRGAGHMVPADKSHWAYVLVNSVTSGPPENPLHALNACMQSVDSHLPQKEIYF